jgi:hypothetical protein
LCFSLKQNYRRKRKMQIAKNNTKVIASALCLIFAMSSLLVLMPTAKAGNTVDTYPFCEPERNPIGVGQKVMLWCGITDACNWPQPGWAGLTITVTAPDGTTQTLGPITTDTTGTTGVPFVPTQVGNYTFVTHFPQNTMLYADVGYAPLEEQSLPVGTVLKASDQQVPSTLTVQQAPIALYPGVPLPTDYWTRPINAQFQNWYSISGNWLRTVQATAVLPTSQVNNVSSAPAAPHVLWTQQAIMGGLVGGDLGNLNGNGLGIGYDVGDAYENKWSSFIISGIYYANVPWPTQSGYQGVYAYDLHTGKLLWFLNNTRMAFGQTMLFSTFNLQGAFAYIWDTSGGTTWKAYDAYTGTWWFTLTNVPVNTAAAGGSPFTYMEYGPQGELLLYNVDIDHGWMTLWNSTNVPGLRRTTDQSNLYFYDQWRPYQKTVNATEKCAVTRETPLGIAGYMWNKTIPLGLARPDMTNQTRADQGGVRKIRGDVLLGSNTERFTKYPDPVSFWALSLKPGHEGELLFNVNYPALPGNKTEEIRDASVADNVFVVDCKETRQWYGYSLSTGKLLWGPTPSQETLDWVGFAQTGWTDVIAYGKLYSGSFSGVMHCYNVTTGELLWTYTNKDYYGESMAGPNWCISISFIADGKIYLQNHEHSGNDPLPRDCPFVCLNATTGEVLWRLPLRMTSGSAILGDGIMMVFNEYEDRAYAFGQGPSAITVTAPDVSNELGKSVVIKGMVTDVSPGTAQYALTARFPNGVPAVSDDSMSQWMEYVYMQYPRPTNATGVDVTLSVLDANNNSRVIGKTTSDADGFFSFQWTPDIPGKYTVQASFAGSKSYYPSQAETAFAVDVAAPTASPVPAAALPPTEMYIAASTIAIIVAIAIVGIVLARKRP